MFIYLTNTVHDHSEEALLCLFVDDFLSYLDGQGKGGRWGGAAGASSSMALARLWIDG